MSRLPTRRVAAAARALLAAGAAAVAALAAPAAAFALQEGATDLASQHLGRGYTHVFIAYALAWAIILGWVIAIARRLARIERRMDQG